MLDGYRPGDPMVRVFTYQADPAGRPPEEIAEEAFDTLNDHPRNPEGEELARLYYRHRLLRSLSVGDIVTVGEVALAVAPAGWKPVHGRLAEVRVDAHGTHPLPSQATPSRPARIVVGGPDGLDIPGVVERPSWPTAVRAAQLAGRDELGMPYSRC